MGRRQGKAIALGLLVLALVVGACGGGGDDEATPLQQIKQIQLKLRKLKQLSKRKQKAEEATEVAEAEEEAEAEVVVVKKTCYVAPNADCSDETCWRIWRNDSS